ncbi:hypothetical protein A9Q84_00860 [Halobacteriovorax marinus]|uniref:Guanylate cyclase domain-containing protein n=1 Tax=Halobacteriovorax marinus TaxID=97084 RepID=A0A1Y5FBL2_9BACT|nr:hypothetical protein A9Q84_00860 [Halobacteriovorax marinus]
MFKIVRFVGLFNLVVFSIISVGIYQFQRQIEYSNFPVWVKNMLIYPSYFEDRFYDFRMNVSRDKTPISKDIALAAIDDLSLKKLGRFPWSRATWVPIIEKLDHYGAKVIAFDVVFSEVERSIAKISPDEEFATAIKKFQKHGKKIIIPYSLASIDQEEDNVSLSETPDTLYNFILESNQEAELSLEIFRVMSTTYPIDKILAADPVLAFIGAKEDPDGVFRKYPVVANLDEMFLPSIALSTYQLLSKETPQINIDAQGSGVLKLPYGELELNFGGETKIIWLGDSTNFLSVPIYQLLEASNDDPDMFEAFKDKAVFIASTAFGAHDLRYTPVDPKLPGVFFHMNMAQMMLDKRNFAPKNSSFLWSWCLMLLGTFSMIAISWKESAFYDAIFVISFSLGLILSDTFYFSPLGYELTLFFVLHAVIGSYLWITMLDFYNTTKDKAFLRQAFGNYISPELIEMMYDSGDQPTLGGKAEELTAFFTDIQSFSSFSEKLSATELVELLNEYLTVMTDILLDEHGTLDKYEGDAIIAFFGAPMHQDDHASRACRVSLKMQEALLELREKWVSEGDKWPAVVKIMRMRIGLNSGEIVTGNMGSKNRMNYTMMGDSVNLAARLEEAAKQYGIFNHVTEFTKNLTGEGFDWRELDTIKVVGKSEPVKTFDLLGSHGETEKNLLDLKETFEKGLEFYKNKQWDEAIKEFTTSIQFEKNRYPNKIPSINPSEVYIKRCHDFKENPPPEEWDGVYTLTAK